MTLLAIRRWPDPVLAIPCQPVDPGEDVATLAADMLDTMYAAPGRGLAAPQVGISKRLFVMDVTWRQGSPDPQVCINPRIAWRSEDSAEGPEGCLSIPGPLTPIRRATSIGLHWTDLAGTAHEETLTGFAAICAQHELDHLDGILTLDHLAPDAREAAIAAITS
ncbi:MAG: peptide deformylase [Gemmobacter sp.]